PPLVAFALHCPRAPPALHPFPTRRSSDLRTSTNFAAHRGVRLDGFRMNGHPAIRAAPDFQPGIAMGKFHGVIRPAGPTGIRTVRSEEHTSELQSRFDLVCRLLLEKKK